MDDGKLMAEAIRLKVYPRLTLAQFYGKITIDVSQMNAAMEKAAIGLARALDDGLRPSITDMNAALQAIIFPNPFTQPGLMQHLADEQRRDMVRKLFEVGDGQTNIIDPRQSDHQNDAVAYSTSTIIDDPYSPDPATEDVEANLLNWYTKFLSPSAGSWAQIIQNTTDTLSAFVDPVQAAKQADRQRSRDDLRKKTRELRKRKGKR